MPTPANLYVVYALRTRFSQATFLINHYLAVHIVKEVVNKSRNLSRQVFSAWIKKLHIYHIDQAQADYLGANMSSGKGSIDHIALAGDNYDSLIDRLQQQQIAYTERTVPLTKEHQVFIQGPDGIALEILFLVCLWLQRRCPETARSVGQA